MVKKKEGAEMLKRIYRRRYLRDFMCYIMLGCILGNSAAWAIENNSWNVDAGGDNSIVNYTSGIQPLTEVSLQESKTIIRWDGVSHTGLDTVDGEVLKFMG